MVNANVGKKKSKRIFYLDALRALAILSVIIIHVFNKTKRLVVPNYGTVHLFTWFITDINLTAFRLGVILFLMLSGALSLGRDWEIRSFLGKRIPRIVGPFLFWGFFLSFIVIGFSWYFNLGWIKTISVSSVLSFIYYAYLFKSPTFLPYWFFWMILGTYFIMPIFNKWLLHADLKEAEYFLVFWLITCIFDFTLFIECPIKLIYFTSPIGLVVLGYYLRHTKRKILNNPYFSIVLIVVPVICMVAISYMYSNPKDIFVFDRYSIFGAIEVIGVFTLFKNFSKLNFRPNFLYNPDGIFRRFVSILAKYSYGIYLTHLSFVLIASKLLFHKGINYYFYNGTLLFVAIFVPLAMLGILNRIPYVNQVIGVK